VLRGYDEHAHESESLVVAAAAGHPDHGPGPHGSPENACETPNWPDRAPLAQPISLPRGRLHDCLAEVLRRLDRCSTGSYRTCLAPKEGNLSSHA
jgi:hypothetical protein